MFLVIPSQYRLPSALIQGLREQLSGKAKVKRQKAKVKTKQYRAPEQFLYLKTFTYLLKLEIRRDAFGHYAFCLFSLLSKTVSRNYKTRK